MALLKSSVIPSEVEESLIVMIPSRMNSKRCLDFARHDKAFLTEPRQIKFVTARANEFRERAVPYLV
jgi:hypothetical protein